MIRLAKGVCHPCESQGIVGQGSREKPRLGRAAFPTETLAWEKSSVFTFEAQWERGPASSSRRYHKPIYIQVEASLWRVLNMSWRGWTEGSGDWWDYPSIIPGNRQGLHQDARLGLAMHLKQIWASFPGKALWNQVKTYQWILIPLLFQ